MQLHNITNCLQCALVTMTTVSDYSPTFNWLQHWEEHLVYSLIGDIGELSNIHVVLIWIIHCSRWQCVDLAYCVFKWCCDNICTNLNCTSHWKCTIQSLMNVNVSITCDLNNPVIDRVRLVSTLATLVS